MEIDFIKREDLIQHVALTITSYGEKLKPYDLKKLNSNLIDPIKMIFDKHIYDKSWEELISNEIFRQRDKSSNNDIGYFHQRIFAYIEHCRVPENGKEGGWDVIYENPNGISIPDGGTVHRVFVEMKNKHNTMNSASSKNTYIKMQNKLLEDDDCSCFLVEAIAKKSQNIPWNTSINGRKVSHRLIRRVSMDNFYSLVTGDSNAFFKVCMALPDVIEEVLTDRRSVMIEPDTAFSELQQLAGETASMAMAMYMLGFSSYLGFREVRNEKNNI